MSLVYKNPSEEGFVWSLVLFVQEVDHHDDAAPCCLFCHSPYCSLSHWGKASHIIYHNYHQGELVLAFTIIIAIIISIIELMLARSRTRTAWFKITKIIIKVNSFRLVANLANAGGVGLGNCPRSCFSTCVRFWSQWWWSLWCLWWRWPSSPLWYQSQTPAWPDQQIWAVFVW